MKRIIIEQGNGFPSAGDYVPTREGELVRLTATDGNIHTGRAGAPNYILAECVLADWSDCPESETFPALACEEAP